MEPTISLLTLTTAHPFWYLASPYSKYPGGIEAAFKEICIVAGKFIEAGVRVYSPIAHTHPIAVYSEMDPMDHDIWIPADAPFMELACGLIIVMMETWDESRGIEIENDAFVRAGKPIYLMEWWHG